MTKPKSSIFFSALCAISLSIGTVGCGGGGDDLRHGDKKFSELSDSEIQNVCEDLTQLLDESGMVEVTARSICYSLAQFGGGECTDEALDECTEAVLAESGGAEGMDCTISREGAATCDVTVAEYQACVEESLAALAPLADATCSDMSSEPELEVSPECDALEERCPDLFDSGE